MKTLIKYIIGITACTVSSLSFANVTINGGGKWVHGNQYAVSAHAMILSEEGDSEFLGVDDLGIDFGTVNYGPTCGPARGGVLLRNVTNDTINHADVACACTQEDEFEGKTRHWFVAYTIDEEKNKHPFRGTPEDPDIIAGFLMQVLESGRGGRDQVTLFEIPQSCIDGCAGLTEQRLKKEFCNLDGNLDLTINYPLVYEPLKGNFSVQGQE